MNEQKRGETSTLDFRVLCENHQNFLPHVLIANFHFLFNDPKQILEKLKAICRNLQVSIHQYSESATLLAQRETMPQT